MSMQDFLNQESEKYAGDFEGFSTIAKVVVAPAFQVGNFGDGTNKLFGYGKSGEGDKARTDAIAYQNEIGSTFSPSFGVALTILVKHVLLGKIGDKNWQQHIRAWEQIENRSKFNSDQQAQLENVTVLPYDAFVGAIENISFGKEIWARLVQVTDEWQEMQVRLGKRKANTYTGKDGTEKTGKHQVYVVKELFKSEADAKAAADGIETKQTSNSGLPFSDKAKANYGNDTANILAQAEEIGVHIWSAYQGIDAIGDDKNPLPEIKLNPLQKALVKKSKDGKDFLSFGSLTIPVELKRQTAKLWMVETTDIDLIHQEKSEAPF